MTAPVPPASTPPSLGPRELARWAWRQLTSMRTALVLLFLLALAAVPGSVVPQERIDPSGVTAWHTDHPVLAPIYDRLGLFSVYNSVWFSAIYILLMVSLVGCIVPRLRIYWRGLRARPPRAPRNLSRLPESRSFALDEDAEVVLDRARGALRDRRYRTDLVPLDADGIGSVAAERGYLREAGNLVFHVCVLVVLVGFAVGQLFGYKGGVIVVAGQGFSNTLSQYDDFQPGTLFEAKDLPDFSLNVDHFAVDFIVGGTNSGQPRSFSADLSYQETLGGPTEHAKLAVNHPVSMGGSMVFLIGHGYAPVVTVRDGNGDVAYKGPVVFLPQDASFSSVGVVKAPDAQPEQLAFEGVFLPTYGLTMQRQPISQFPDALDPRLSLIPYHGDLGLDTGQPQSVYDLDKDGVTMFTKKNGNPYRLDIAVGQTKKLPDGAGSITFDGVDRWVKLQVSENPGKRVALGGVVLAIIGLLASLFIRPRRAWVRVTRRDGRTLVELAGLDRSGGGDLEGEIDRLERLVRNASSDGEAPPPGRPDSAAPEQEEKP